MSGGALWKERFWGTVENYLDNCVHTKVDSEALERLEPENEGVSLRYILKDSTRGGSNIFQLFGTAEKKDHFVASRKRWLQSQGEKATEQESWQNEWHGIWVPRRNGESSPCPERTLKTPMPQQSSPSSRDEESQWVAVEDKRRRRVAFEETAKDILRYLEDSEDLKVSVTELQEQLGMSEEAGISIKQVTQQARNENGQFF